VPGVDIFIFGIIPIAAYVFHKVFAWVAWVAAPVAIAVGFLVLYLAIAPATFLQNWEPFCLDIFGAFVFGALVILAFERTGLS
jgi:hypothetical protein